MRRFFVSLFRIIGWSGFLSISLVLALGLWYLPPLLNLDPYRASFIDFLEEVSRCKVLMGHAHAELVPYPGVVIDDVVFLEASQPPRVLAAVGGVHLWLSWKALLDRRLHVRTIRFWKCSLQLHRVEGPDGQRRWVYLRLPTSRGTGRRHEVSRWEIRDSRLEVWDHTASPAQRWTINHLSGAYRTWRQSGQFQATLPSLTHPEWTEAVFVRGEFLLHNGLWSLTLKTQTSPAMTVSLEARLSKEPWRCQGSLRGYNAGVFERLFDQRWLNGLTGGQGITFSATSGSAERPWTWNVEGKDFGFDGTDFRLPQFSICRDTQSYRVDVQAVTPTGGKTHVVWQTPAGEIASTLNIQASSVTIDEILTVFNVRPSSGIPKTGWNPHGYEAWSLAQASLNALLQPGLSFEIHQSSALVAGMGTVVQVTGSFGLGAQGQAHIEGSLANIPVGSVLESFDPVHVPLTGTGRCTFDLTFPLSNQWLQGSSGQFSLEVGQGLCRSFKTIYRVAALLNLGNYLRLRLPQVAAQGIPFDSLTGHLRLFGGVFYSDDLFLKSPNMNVGLQGAADVVNQRLDIVLRIQLLRFVEDILENVSGLCFILRGKNKILLPLVVSVKGPWDHLELH
jgi:hypothetical protein